MRSPFPGMDPWLERHWLDVRGRLVTYFCDELAARLPPDLTARTEERVTVEPEADSPGLVRSYHPDGRVYEVQQSFAAAAAAAVLDSPGLLIEEDAETPNESATQRFVRVEEGERLITVIELLSPTNKQGDGLSDYLYKRRDLLAAGVNVVEIDLVRAGDWHRLIRPARQQPPASTYRVMTRVAGRANQLIYLPIGLSDPLPSVVVPLRVTDALVRIELQPLLDKVYQNGRYDRTDYARPLDPPLSPSEQAIAQVLLAGRSNK